MHRETGTRAELVATLRDMSTGWFLRANDELSEAAAAGADQLEDGAFSVKVGHTVYTVTDDQA